MLNLTLAHVFDRSYSGVVQDESSDDGASQAQGPGLKRLRASSCHEGAPCGGGAMLSGALGPGKWPEPHAYRGSIAPEYGEA